MTKYSQVGVPPPSASSAHATAAAAASRAPGSRAPRQSPSPSFPGASRARAALAPRHAPAMAAGWRRLLASAPFGAVCTATRASAARNRLLSRWGSPLALRRARGDDGRPGPRAAGSQTLRLPGTLPCPGCPPPPTAPATGPRGSRRTSPRSLRDDPSLLPFFLLSIPKKEREERRRRAARDTPERPTGRNGQGSRPCPPPPSSSLPERGAVSGDTGLVFHPAGRRPEGDSVQCGAPGRKQGPDCGAGTPPPPKKPPPQSPPNGRFGFVKQTGVDRLVFQHSQTETERTHRPSRGCGGRGAGGGGGLRWPRR